MGEAIYRASDDAKAVYEVASEVTGVDIAEVCFGSETDRLAETLVAQPAIAAVSISEYYYLKKRGFMPDVGMGHSMGEIPLLAMVGAVSLRDTFKLLQVRATATSEASKERPGIMAAVSGLTIEDVKSKTANILAGGRTVVANLNSTYQQVFSGDHKPMHELEELIRNLRVTDRIKVKYTELRTGGAFHSPYHMENAVGAFHDAAQSVTLLVPEFDLMLNNATYLSEVGLSNLPAYLSQQLVSGVNFTGGVERLVDDGVTNFVEVGSSNSSAKYKTLSGLIKRDFADRVHILEVKEIE
ncbi:ACP S-malonyltransferase [Candidatus Saccharibacteria bacterium]|nr:ACP S-malonyltransferase [Candidatus Saccharibacteria bacterium]